MEIEQLDSNRFVVRKDTSLGMNTDVVIYSDNNLIEKIKKDRTLQQAANAATLPRLVGNILLMPDSHEGYGFPIGGVMASSAEDGFISPGSVGFDINCLHPCTKVQLNDGTYKEIRKIKVKDLTSSFDYGTKKRIKTRPILIIKKLEERKIFIIKTKAGNEIEVTGEHPILTSSGMCQAKNLKVGYKVVVNNLDFINNYPNSWKIGNGFSYDEILRINSETYYGRVYDLSINNHNHNFIAEGIVVSNCGIRLIKTTLTEKDIRPKINVLSDELFKNIPSGVGSRLNIGLTQSDLEKVSEEGSQYIVEKGFGDHSDIEHTEENGKMLHADLSKVSQQARSRGIHELGTLGAGNHFLEIQKVDKIFDEKIAKNFGLQQGQIVVMVHTGSRGFGHQICSDYLKMLVEYQRKNNIKLVDPELSYAFVGTKEAQDYLFAMRSAVNFAFTNRQIITNSIRKSFENVLGKSWDALGMEMLYDLSHNIAKLEEHIVEGKRTKVYVHRKGATRAFAKGREEIPKRYRDIGQPVLIPGSMGTASYVLCGAEGAMAETFGSACHGAGRVMSRHEAIRTIPPSRTFSSLKEKNIEIRIKTRKLVSEEAEWTYKDVDRVVSVVENANIAKIVSRNVPLAVIKG